MLCALQRQAVAVGKRPARTASPLSQSPADAIEHTIRYGTKHLTFPGESLPWSLAWDFDIMAAQALMGLGAMWLTLGAVLGCCCRPRRRSRVTRPSRESAAANKDED